MRHLAVALVLSGLALGTSPALAQQSAPLSGPPGTSLNKVLVIGTDGTRWDLLQAAVRSGKAPNLGRLQRQGFGRPSLLDYAPDVLTISEVGWASIAAGVWPDKHGIKGNKLNRDPLQRTKNGYLDFLTRIERTRPSTSTFIASDWANIALPLNGGPIFNTADARYALDTNVETLAAWDGGDELVTRATVRYLRNGDPDAGFVYLGIVDETAHLVGSATPSYPAAIARTDARIGRMLAAIRARPSYAFESWTVLVTTDHGERPLDYPSTLSHFGKTPLEITSFVLGDGPGLGSNVRRPLVVDLLPTVLNQLGLRTPAAWNIDGRRLSRARPPSSATARARRGRLRARFRLGSAPRVGTARLRLPAGVRFTGPVGVAVNGRARRAARSRKGLAVSLKGRRLRSLAIAAPKGSVRVSSGVRSSARLRLTLRSRGRTVGALQVRLR